MNEPSVGVEVEVLEGRHERVFLVLFGLFVTFVVLTNTVGSKLFVAFGWVFPVSILWYPLTFLVTDIVSEVYGARRARFLVVSGFGMSLVLLVFSLAGVALPAASFYEAADAYRQVFSPVGRLLFASMAAYLLAQSIDVQLFHFWKRRTQGRHLWLRNNGSTMVSQLVDSFTVTFIFLYDNPAVFSGTVGDLVRAALASYIGKVVIAAVDTPFCYLGVGLVRRYTAGSSPSR